MVYLDIPKTKYYNHVRGITFYNSRYYDNIRHENCTHFKNHENIGLHFYHVITLLGQNLLSMYWGKAPRLSIISIGMP